MSQSLAIRLFCFLSFSIATSASWGQESASESESYRTEKAIPYWDSQFPENRKHPRCKLDLYYPTDQNDYPTVVWFHGGGLTGGERHIPEQLKGHGFAIAAASYRLSPEAKSPEFIEDAAAAVAWVFHNIESRKGSKTKIYVAGASAGGYLTCMIGLDKQWLAKHQIDANSIAGLIPYSGQVITHFTIRKEQNIPETQPVVDKFAPLYHVRRDSPPLWLITGDRELEMLGRYEENAYMARMMKVAGHKHTELFELDGFNHGEMVIPAHGILLKILSAANK